MSLRRIGWTGLLGALAGLVLFPRPARGPGVKADPPARVPGDRSPGHTPPGDTPPSG